jgi:hypothetical protein
MTRRCLIPALVAAFALSGCALGVGDKEAVVKVAKTEGIYIDVGPLDYQVQHSRQINAADTPDKEFLTGVPDYVTAPTDEETWFAVWLRVQNQTEETTPSAADFEIEDTLGKKFHPVPIKFADNPLVYEARDLQPAEVFPAPDSLAGDSPTQGLALIFKIPYTSLGNRPLEFRITAEDGDVGVVDLDV